MTWYKKKEKPLDPTQVQLYLYLQFVTTIAMKRMGVRKQKMLALLKPFRIWDAEKLDSIRILLSNDHTETDVILQIIEAMSNFINRKFSTLVTIHMTKDIKQAICTSDWEGKYNKLVNLKKKEI